MHALARIGMLVEMGAIELRQAMRVVGEVAGHPVEQHADAGGVEALDQAAEIAGRAEAGGRRVEADRLVAPGAVEGMLADRQQLDMGEAHLGDVGHQLVAELAPGEEAVALLRLAPPRPEMHLVDRHRRIERIGSPPRLGIAGGRGRRRRDDRRGRRPELGGGAVGIGLERQQPALRRTELELVAIARGHPGQEQLPHAAFAAQPHRVAPPVPQIEVADDTDPAGRRRPDRERDALDAQQRQRPRAEPLERPVMRPLGEQPHIDLAEHRGKAVGILELDRRFAPGDAQPIGRAERPAERPDEEAGGMAPLQPGDLDAGRRLERDHRAGVGHEDAQLGPPVIALVGPQHRERIAMPGLDQRLDRGDAQHGGKGCMTALRASTSSA